MVACRQHKAVNTYCGSVFEYNDQADILLPKNADFQLTGNQILQPVYSV